MNTILWYFVSCQHEQAVEKTINLPAISGAKMLMGCHYDAYSVIMGFHPMSNDAIKSHKCSFQKCSRNESISFWLAWWRHQMETFSALLTLCAGNSPVPGEFPAQRPVTRSFDIFFDLRLNKRLSKQTLGWWFETFSCSLWSYRTGLNSIQLKKCTATGFASRKTSL